MMYRRYEDPRKLEQQLAELKEIKEQMIVAGADEDELIDITLDIHEMEERVNFAWQDDEYESEIRAQMEMEEFYENTY